MKFKLQSQVFPKLGSAFAIFLWFGILGSTQSAVLVLSQTGETVTTFSDGDPTDNNPVPEVDERDLVNEKGDVGDVWAEVALLNIGLPEPESFVVTSSFLSVGAVRTVNAGKPVEASALSEFEITFELREGECGNLELDFAYEIQDLGINPTLTWSLDGPDPGVSGFAGLLEDPDEGAASLSGQVSQSLQLTTAGTYTFTIQAEVPLQALNNGNPSGFAELDNFVLSYDVVKVPEPTTLLLLGLGSVLLGRSRVRKNKV